jgi:ATP-dependent RNA helicase DDX51/DBP6
VYALPILQALLQRVQPRLRALVLLPTNDLALQVHAVLEMLIDACEGCELHLRHACDNQSPAARAAAAARAAGAGAAAGVARRRRTDILVATPGRLVAKMRDEPGFAEELQGLEWLVIDDADRLLQQSHQAWLPKLMQAIEARSSRAPNINKPPRRTEGEGGPHLAQLSPSCPGGAGLSLCNWLAATSPALGDVEASLGWERGAVRKLILSATLTRHPAKLHALRLRRPRALTATAAADSGGGGGGGGGRFTLPSTLLERAAVVPPGAKPLALVLELLAHRQRQHGGGLGGGLGGCIVFTATVEHAHRLARLLQLFGPGPGGGAGLGRVAEYSSRQQPSARRAALAQLAEGSLQVLISL